MMYEAFVRWVVRNFYRHLNQGDYEYILKRYGSGLPEGHFFVGDSALSGDRHSIGAIRRWYARLSVLFPVLRVELKRVFVQGWPWNTVAVMEWTDQAHPRDGQDYANSGVQITFIRWGRAVGTRYYLDTSKVNQVCQRLAAIGVKEAVAPPIED